MISKESIGKFVTRVWGNQSFLILFVFNLLSNVAAVSTYGDLLSIFLIVCISALSATVESCICRMFSNTTVRRCLLWLFVALHLLMAIVDFFLIINFQMMFSSGTIGIMAETNPAESQSFLSTYLNLPSLLAYVLVVGLVIVATVWITRRLSGNKPLAILAMLLSAGGVLTYAHMVYGHLVLGEGGDAVSQLHSFTRLGHSFLTFRSIHGDMEKTRELNRNLQVTLRDADAPSVVVIIGESFSLFHSSLYGYAKDTNPLLAARVNDSSLVVCDDVVAVSDHTGHVMHSVFTANGSGEPLDGEAMFPSFFRAAGYKTALLDNQYFVGNGYTWITDKVLSEVMFDYRNMLEVGFDANLIKQMPQFDDPQLIVFHLFGQHYIYADRYPAQFKRFKAADYSSALTPDEREIVAHYDNATLYNDYVVDSIIKRFEDKNCVVVYCSDHGEELYEIDDFMGHGNAPQRPTIDYQVRVPFMVWTSPRFQARYPELTRQIRQSAHKPIITDNLPHFLFDVAGIVTPYFCPELSFINDSYQASKPRIVLGTIDFDNTTKRQPVKPRY